MVQSFTSTAASTAAPTVANAASTQGDKNTVTNKQRDDAETYLAQKRVPQTIQLLASQLLFKKPDNPKEFMIEKLEEMKTFRLRNQAMPFFNRDDLMAYFRTLDVTGKGWITFAQYTEAMKTLGVSRINYKPKGYDKNEIIKEVFQSEAIKGLSSND